QDAKLNAWLRLCLDTLKQDRRSSKNINFSQYFITLNRFWKVHLYQRNAHLETRVDDTLTLKCFEIELDCIFNNLIANSYEAFKRPGFKGDKKISISITKIEGVIEIIYKDTGPGISISIKNPNKIFEPLFTTKTDNEGNATGTGLGMSLVKGSIDDLKGTIHILSKSGESGFATKIEIPSK
ncbi:MAG: HAMP domain-containing histidine kinase, partial [Alphaproteobacteria bacterium]|nr:HAMP domain-containing histidine kinase [Alphaproteobacteria bacterium]